MSAADSSPPHPDDDRRDRLAAAIGDRNLREALPPVARHCFGVVVTGRSEETLEVACRPDPCPGLLDALGAVTGREIRPWDCPAGEIAAALAEDDSGALNLPTFDDPDFLEDEDARGRLLHEKVEDVPAVPPPVSDAMLLVDVAIRSHVTDVDEPGRSRAVDGLPRGLGVLQPSFRVVDGRPVPVPLWLAEHSPRMVARVSLLQEGAEDLRALLAAATNDPPLVLFPSEVQLLVGSGDGLELWVDGRTEAVALGDAAEFDADWHLLVLGRRLHRRLTVRILGSWLVEDPRPAGPGAPDPGQDVRRWLGAPWTEERRPA